MASFLAGSCASQTIYRDTDRDRHRKERHTWEGGGRGEALQAAVFVRMRMYVWVEEEKGRVVGKFVYPPYRQKLRDAEFGGRANTCLERCS